MSLSASGHLEVPQDWLTVVLSTTREGSDAATVQNQLKVAVDAALAIAQPQAKPQQLEVRTGNLRLNLALAAAMAARGWQGQAEVVIEGRDIANVSAVACRVQTRVARRGRYRLRSPRCWRSDARCRAHQGLRPWA